LVVSSSSWSIGRIGVRTGCTCATRMGGYSRFLLAGPMQVRARQAGHLPQPATLQPQPQHFLDFDHRHLPVAHSANTAAEQPEAPTPRRGGPITGKPASQVVLSMANQWSHAHGKTAAELVPCSWQPTTIGCASYCTVESPGSITPRHHYEVDYHAWLRRALLTTSTCSTRANC
jgi:hypothetical protein